MKTDIDPNPKTERTATISGYAEAPVELEIATEPMAASWSIVSTWANGRKNVGLVMVGGTVEQFDNAVRLQKIKNKRNGFWSGPFIHATAGSWEGYEDDGR